MGLQGVGGTSANRILNYLKGHRTITKLQQLLELAPQLVVEQFQNFHKFWTWASEIEEFRGLRPADLSPKAAPEDEQATATVRDLQTDTQYDQPDDLRKKMREMRADINKLYSICEKFDMDELKSMIENLGGGTSNAQINENTKKISAVETSVQRLNDSMDQLRFEMRTSQVIDAKAQKTNALWQDKAGATSAKSDSLNRATDKGLGQGRSNRDQSVRSKTNTWDRISEDPVVTESEQLSGLPRGGARRPDTPDTRNAKLVEKFEGVLELGRIGSTSSSLRRNCASGTVTTCFSC